MNNTNPLSQQIGGANSQAILNINSGSDLNFQKQGQYFDINIYNNSFIVNTSSSKKQSHSQNQSRSSSLKRNQSRNIPQAQNANNKIINPQKYINAAAMNLQNLLAVQNPDYSGRSNTQQKHQRSFQQISQPFQNDNPKQNQYMEAYSTQNFFGAKAQNSSQRLNNSQRSKLQSFSQHSKSQSSQSVNPIQQRSGSNNAQHSFELPQFISSTDHEFSNISSKDISAKQSRIKFGYPKKNSSSQLKSYVSHTNYESQQSPQLYQEKSNKSKVQSQTFLNEGKKKLLEKDYQGAIKLFSDSMVLDQNNTDAKFYRALSYMDAGMVKEAIFEFQQIINSSPSHSQITHILISIAYKRMNDMQSALNIHKDYPDAYLARGQALLLQENYEQAQKDFSQYTQLMPNNGIGYIGQGDSLKAMKKLKEAINSYSKAVNLLQKQGNQNQPNLNGKAVFNKDETQQMQLFQALLKRGLAYFQIKNYQQALPDLQQVVLFEKTNIKAHFYIGKILSYDYVVTPRIDSKEKQKIQSDAILHFEQVVKYHSNEIYTGNALFEIAKLRLQDKDFYEAYFNLKRAVDCNFNSKRLQLYKDFTEGVLYLIKRKIKKGVQILSDLLEVLVNTKEKKDRKQLDFLKHQCYIYRAYGYVAIEKYEVALQDIKKAKKVGKLDLSSIYNKLLGKGILRMDHEDYLMATKYFNKASHKFPQNKDPYCLYIISIVRSYSYSMNQQTIDYEEKRDQVMKAKEFMDRAILNCSKVKIPSLYFFRGLLYFQLHMFYEALKDFNVAIEEEEEPTASYYLARGRTYACLSILTEAMKDLSISLNLDDSAQEAYIYRGKCAYLLGDNNLAFLDFQRLILTDPKNPMVHVYAGNLLMTTGAYQDAIKAFLNADTVQKTAVAAFQRARCYCAMTDLENAKMQFKIALQLCKTEKLIQIDSQCLTALMRVINSNSGNASKQISSAIEIINNLIKMFEGDDIQNLKKKDCILNIQIIPNVKRIKVEKVAVAKELIAQQSEQKDVSLSIDLNQTVDLDSLKNMPLYSYYYENVFSLEDFYLFRAVFYFYNKEYQKAIKDYELCQQLKIDSEKKSQNRGGANASHATMNDHESMIMYNQSQSSTPNLSMNSSKTDLSDVGLCSLNVHETNYNILLCYIMMENYKKAIEKLNELISSSPNKYQRHFFLIRAQIYEKNNQKEYAIKDLQKYEKYEQQNYNTFFKERKDIVLEPFPIKSRLCSKFEFVKLQISNNSSTQSILTKPSFSMPFIKPPNMIPNIDEEAIQNEFTLKQIDAPMPEAPWIRRGPHGIKFTDDMLQDEIEDFDIEEQKHNDNQNAPSKAHIQNSAIEQSPYSQSVEVPRKKGGKGISEQILQNAMVYLVENDEEQLSDKHKISLFDDSKFEDLTIDQQTNSKKRNENKLLQDSMNDEPIHGSASENEEDDDSSSQDEEVVVGYKPGERDSMVLVGDSQVAVIKKNQTGNKLEIGSALMNNTEKQKIISELNDKIGSDDELNINERDSIFRSRQSSKR